MDAIHGRGALGNPENRFTEVFLDRNERDEDWDEPGIPPPKTQYFLDSSKSALSYNDSPDIGMEAGINPYRGCSHGCVYCLSGDTPILMADSSTKPLRHVRVGDTIYGTVRRGSYRRYVRTRVLAHWRVMEPSYRVSLEDGTKMICGENHRFLTGRGWKFITGTEHGENQRPHLTCNNKLMGVGGLLLTQQETKAYRLGYLSGMVRGDGLLKFYPYQRAGRTHGNIYQFRLALVDREGLRRTKEFLANFGVETDAFLFQKPRENRKPIYGIRTSSRRNLSKIQGLIQWPEKPPSEWMRGFLAGIFDAEGSYSGGVFRIVNTDAGIMDYVKSSLDHFSFRFQESLRARANPIHTITLRGGLREHLRFFHLTDPSIRRKCNIRGQAVKHGAKLRVVSIEATGVKEPLFDITTGTGDFIANGVISHNCYARPTHEYFELSAGLDFESKIFVKPSLPDLLRKEFASPKYQPTNVMMSGVTDCYQPIEKELEITRNCLKVFLEFRNPVGIVTKNFLVTRDIDLLVQLTKVRCVSVLVSVTSLRPELIQVMEPRTARPARRLEAIRLLREAGVNVGVMVGPIIPALNEEEVPQILMEAGKAGARFAAHTLLRLPYAVAPMFEQWLEAHFPDRKEKVLNRIRSMRGGKLNDPRFGSRMRGEGIFAEQVHKLFAFGCKRAGIRGGFGTTTKNFRNPNGTQLKLF